MRFRYTNFACEKWHISLKRLSNVQQNKNFNITRLVESLFNFLEHIERQTIF